MVVSKHTLINKMIAQLELAKEGKEEKFTQHIESVRLLCEIILEEEHDDRKTEPDQISEQELKAMLGDTEENPFESKSKQYDDANGDSIFDF